jgi:putative heme-binding domain-containing protein
MSRSDSRLQADCHFVAALLGDPDACQALRGWLVPKSDLPRSRQLTAFEVLAAAGDRQVIHAAAELFRQADDEELLAGVIAAVGQLRDLQAAALLVDHFDALPAPVQARAVEQLTRRSEWAHVLLAAIAAERVPREALHINQLRRLQRLDDPQLQAQILRIWGTIREGRNPQIEETIDWVRDLVLERPGNAMRGHEVFRKACGQCHQIYGEGEQVGPDITRNGRASFEQLLSNVFDPNLVIGSGYQAQLVITADGRSLSGLLVSESAERVVLKLQGGKEEAIARDQIEEMVTSPLSLMPEGWEKQLSEQEVVDLLHFLTLDGPPEQPQSKRLPDTPALK